MSPRGAGPGAALLAASVLLTRLASAALPCATALDCSGAGQCIDGGCVCAAGWMGASCAALDNRTAIPLASGFRLPGSHVWGSQVVFADGEFIMLASIYPAALPFYTSWLYTAQICVAASATPLGPYAWRAMALPYGSEASWDRSVMNPKVLRAPGNGPFLLYYTGSSYAGPTPDGGATPLPKNQSAAQASQRIGLATAPAAAGPYTRTGAPVLEPAPDSWDARITTNSAVVAFGGGSDRLLLVYKGSSPAGAGSTQTRVCIGVAIAARWDAPFVRPRSDPILPCPPGTFYAEDPSVHRDATTGVFHLIIKDGAGHFTHAGYSGMHWVSVDGVSWNATEPALAYTTTHVWSDGRTRTMAQQERPEILLDVDEPHAPLVAFFATNTALNGTVDGEFWNMAMPLTPKATEWRSRRSA